MRPLNIEYWGAKKLRYKRRHMTLEMNPWRALMKDGFPRTQTEKKNSYITRPRNHFSLFSIQLPLEKL